LPWNLHHISYISLGTCTIFTFWFASIEAKSVFIEKIFTLMSRPDNNMNPISLFPRAQQRVSRFSTPRTVLALAALLYSTPTPLTTYSIIPTTASRVTPGASDGIRQRRGGDD
jgi:hypothetical protein